MTLPGSLVLVATPIGNLGDLSARALEALRDAEVVACEDTRRTRRLLSAAGIRGTRLEALHAHNERARTPALVAAMEAGATVALVSDAGMPTISDPGSRLVAAAVAAGLPVSVVPGPSAAVAAVALSGFSANRWVFEGFLPTRGRERRERVAAIAAETRPVVCYEAPHRVASTLAELAAACGEGRAAVLARELTKLHEEVWRGSLGELATRAAEGESRGEHTLVVAGAPPDSPAEAAEIRAAVLDALASGSSTREAAATAARRCGCPRAVAYRVALEVRSGGSVVSP